MKTADLKEAVKVLYPVVGGNGNISFSELSASAIGDGVRVDLMHGDASYPGGVATVNARSLRDTVSKIKTEDTEVGIDDGHVILKAGRLRTKMVRKGDDVSPLTMDADDVDGVIDLERDDLAVLLERVRYAAAGGDDVNPVLNAVHLHTDGAKLVSAATNGHRLARHAVKAGVRGDPKITVPMRAVEVIQSFLDYHGEKNNCHVDLLVGGGRAMVRTDRGAVTFTLIDGEFPDYRAIMPEMKDGLELDTIRFSEALDRLMVVAPPENHLVMALFDGNEMVLKADFRGRDAEEVIDYEGESQERLCAFNAKYMREAVEGQECRIAFNATGPIVIHGLCDEQYRAVVMPINVGGTEG